MFGDCYSPKDRFIHIKQVIKSEKYDFPLFVVHDDNLECRIEYNPPKTSKNPRHILENIKSLLFGWLDWDGLQFFLFCLMFFFFHFKHFTTGGASSL